MNNLSLKIVLNLILFAPSHMLDLCHSKNNESTSAPWVILVINVNISLVGLIPLSSIFQISSTMAWQGQEDVEPFQNAKDKDWQKLKILHSI